MKHLKIYEYYYDQNGKLYSDDEFENLPDSFFSSSSNNKLKYINPSMEKHIPELYNIKDRLIEINTEIEIDGPLDEEIQDSIDALNNVLGKWENRPIVNIAAKKYNL